MTDNEKIPPRQAEATGAPHTEHHDSSSIDDSSEALRVGQQILAIQAVLENPNQVNAINTVVELGTDSRYYVLVRGWLQEQLRADQSILDARRDQGPPKILERVVFLKKAIRAIDLE